MIVLSRKVGQEIYINGGEIVVCVERINGNQVRLSFSAPDDVAIDRKEVHELKIAKGQQTVSPRPLGKQPAAK